MAEVTRRASLLGRLIGYKKIQIHLWRSLTLAESAACVLSWKGDHSASLLWRAQQSALLRTKSREMSPPPCSQSFPSSCQPKGEQKQLSTCSGLERDYSEPPLWALKKKSAGQQMSSLANCLYIGKWNFLVYTRGHWKTRVFQTGVTQLQNTVLSLDCLVRHRAFC